MARVFFNDQEVTKSSSFNFKENDTFIVIDPEGKKSQIISNHSKELQLLKDYGEMVLGKDIPSTIIENWVLGKMYYQEKKLSLPIKKYKLNDIKNKLSAYMYKKTNPVDIYPLIVFSYSLLKDGAKVFIFEGEDSLTMLLLQSEYKNSMVYYNKLSTYSKNKFRNAIKDVFYEMGLDFVPVVITDGYRTMDEQAQRVYDRGCQYYMDKVGNDSPSYPYLETLKKIYNDKLNMESVLLESNIVDGAKSEIRKHKGDLLATLKALINEYFNPSFHTIGQSLDIRIKDNHKKTAGRILDKTGGYSSNDHNHLNLL